MKRLFQFSSLMFLAVCAVGCGKDAAKEAETSSAPTESADFDSLMSKGVASIAQKDAGAAMEAAAKAVDIQPESAEARLLAGQAAYRGEDFKQAHESFSAVIKEASLPDALRAKAYVGLGMVDFVQHDYDMARIAFLQALWLDPKNEAALYHLGKLYDEVYQFLKAARDQFQMFAYLSERSHPGNSRAQKVRDAVIPEINRKIDVLTNASGGNATKAAQLVQEAQALREKGQKDKNLLLTAKQKYDEARKTDPQLYAAALGYAQLVRETEKTAEGAKKAIGAYMKASSLKPSIPENYLEAARLARQYADECKIQAAEIMNRAVAHHPQNREVLDQLVAALQKTGNDKLAKAWGEYRSALKR